MIKNLFKKKVIVLLTFSLIGLLVHFKSFQMVPYGDDWTFIFDYLAYEHKPSHVNINYPGMFSYLTPYGPAILTIGIVYQIFGRTYYIYYLIPLIFKILVAFLLFLILQELSISINKKNIATNLFVSILFLVGATGIQSIDWSMNMNVFIALLIFTLGLFFQIKYFNNQDNHFLIISFILFLATMLFAPTRFTPLMVILPLVDLIFIKTGYKQLKVPIIKNVIFAICIYFFFQIGIFGQPGVMNNISLIGPFILNFLENPILTLQIFFHWIGITIFPVFPASDITLTSFIGVVFLSTLIIILYTSRNKWLVTATLLYLIPLILMWYSSRVKIEDSAVRHLVVPFFGLCFLLGIICLLKSKSNFLRLLLIFLILIHIYFLEKIYTHWLSIGRGKDFILPVQEKIMSHFSTPLSEPKLIFLDFDDGAFQQSIEFGLGYRIAVLSGTKNINPLPRSFSNKPTLIKAIQEEIKKGKSKEDVINSTTAFELKNRVFSDTTATLREELRKEI